MFAKLLHNHQVQEGHSQHQATLPPCPDTPWRRAAETLIDWTFFLMTRTKLASVGFVAARNCMRQQVPHDAKSLPNCGRSQSTKTCKLPTHQRVPSTTFCKYVMIIRLSIIGLPQRIQKEHAVSCNFIRVRVLNPGFRLQLTSSLSYHGTYWLQHVLAPATPLEILHTFKLKM